MNLWIYWETLNASYLDEVFEKGWRQKLENVWPEKTGSYLMEPKSWGYGLYDLGAICTYRLGLYQKSFAYAKSALALQPDNERLKRIWKRFLQN